MFKSQVALQDLGISVVLFQATMAIQVDHPGAASAPAEASALGEPPAWTSDPVWQTHCQGLDSLPICPSILELCAGAGTASIALQLLLGAGKARLAGAWDTDVGCLGIHQIVHGGGQPGLHFG